MIIIIMKGMNEGILEVNIGRKIGSKCTWTAVDDSELSYTTSLITDLTYHMNPNPSVCIFTPFS